MRTLLFAACSFWFLLSSCHSGENEFDAQGTFEATEVMVSPEISGRLLAFPVHEGDELKAGQEAGKIDDKNLSLQKEQVNASISALKQKTADVSPQVQLLNDQLAVQNTQLNNLQKELARTERLIKNDAATEKQADDIRYQIEALQKQMQVTRQQIEVQRSGVATQNRSILSETDPLTKREEQIADLIERSRIVNPVTGTVLATYTEPGEMVAAGKPVYKIADLSELNLRAYITGEQLSLIKQGQKVKVFTDKGKNEYNEYEGTVSWISSKAEFTPKTIQTKEERAGLVYAIKVKVKNSGYLKIGMYGEVKF
jgi:HlyD family secretion protein